MAVHAGRKAHAHKAAFAAYAVDNRIRPPLLHRMFLPVGGVKVAAVGRNLPMPAGNHVVKRLRLAAAVFHRDAAVLPKRHFPITVVAAAGRNQHHRGIQHRIAAVTVGEVFVVCAAKERRDRRLDRRRSKVVPINAQHKGMADVAGKPDVRNHARAVRVAEHGGFTRLNLDARAQLFAVSATRTAAFFPRWVLGRKAKSPSVLHSVKFHLVSSLILRFYITDFCSASKIRGSAARPSRSPSSCSASSVGTSALVRPTRSGSSGRMIAALPSFSSCSQSASWRL